jgi:hypothetical protein
MSRWRIGDEVAAWLMRGLVALARPLTFRAVRRHFGL